MVGGLIGGCGWRGVQRIEKKRKNGEDVAMEIMCRGRSVTSAGYVGVRIFSVDAEMRNELPICMSLHDAGTTNGNENATEKIEFSILTPYQVLITCRSVPFLKFQIM
jgi:hypothetical protein